MNDYQEQRIIEKMEEVTRAIYATESRFYAAYTAHLLMIIVIQIFVIIAILLWHNF